MLEIESDKGLIGRMIVLAASARFFLSVLSLFFFFYGALSVHTLSACTNSNTGTRAIPNPNT